MHSRRWLWLLALALALGCAQGTATRDSTPPSRGDAVLLPELGGEPLPPARVLLLSVAGLAPSHYRFAAGVVPMPTLAALADRGVSADAVEAVLPASVHVVHASLVTGRRSNEHGISADHLLGDHGVRNTRYEHASRLRGASLWQRAGDAGLSVASLAWPTTVGANVDFLLPDIRGRTGEDWLELASSASTPWLIERIARSAPEAPRVGWPSNAQRDQLVVDLACELARSPTVPALWLLRFEQAGEAARRFGPDAPDALRALGEVDRQIARLATCLRRSGLLDSSAILVTGDVGVLPVHTRIDPNVALLRAGLIQLESRVPSAIRSWSAISRGHGGSALVYARREVDAVSARRALEAAAVETGAFRVVAASELKERGVDPRAWFGLDAVAGYRFGGGVIGPVLSSSQARGASGAGGAATSARVGFVAWGRGVRRSVRVPLLRQLDIAPTAASLLGLQLTDARGRVFVGALEISDGDRSPPAARRP